MAKPLPFTQASVKRAVKAVEDAGVKVGRVEFGIDGKMVIFAADGANTEPATDFDAWKVKRNARSS